MKLLAKQHRGKSYEIYILKYNNFCSLFMGLLVMHKLFCYKLCVVQKLSVGDL